MRLRLVSLVVLILLSPLPSLAQPSILTGPPVPRLSPGALDRAPGMPIGIRPAGTEISSPAIAPDGPTWVSGSDWYRDIGMGQATPVFHDLDGDGVQEIIAAGGSDLMVYDADGNLLPGWPQQVGLTMMHAGVGDVDGDGEDEIAIGSMLGSGPILSVYERDGTSLPGWPVQLPFVVFLNIGCPVVADIDGDGANEIGVAAEMGVFFFESDGRPVPGWPYLWNVESNNPQWSAPAVADVDADGRLEVVVGETNVPSFRLHVIRDDGTAAPGWPIPFGGTFASPALADLDRDGDLEIIIVEGGTFLLPGGSVFVFHHDGPVAEGWPRRIAPEWWGSRASPAVGDLDGDGRLEIVALSGDDKLHVFDEEGNYLPGFPLSLGLGLDPNSSPTLADVDGDGRQEIFFNFVREHQVFAGAWNLDALPLPGFPVLLLENSNMIPLAYIHLSDREGDGDWDLATMVEGWDGIGARLWVREVAGSVCWPYISRADWPRMRHDPANTGLLGGNHPVTWPSSSAPLLLWPNPVSPNDRLGFLPASDQGERGRLSLWDLAGRRLGQSEWMSAPQRQPLRDLFGPLEASGVYFVRWTPETPAAPIRQARLVVLER